MGNNAKNDDGRREENGGKIYFWKNKQNDGEYGEGGRVTSREFLEKNVSNK